MYMTVLQWECIHPDLKSRKQTNIERLQIGLAKIAVPQQQQNNNPYILMLSILWQKQQLLLPIT